MIEECIQLKKYIELHPMGHLKKFIQKDVGKWQTLDHLDKDNDRNVAPIGKVKAVILNF